MKVIKYCFYYLYNNLLDYLDLTPNNIMDLYIDSYIRNKHLIVDIIDTNIISTKSIIKNLRWNMFYKKYKD